MVIIDSEEFKYFIEWQFTNLSDLLNNVEFNDDLIKYLRDSESFVRLNKTLKNNSPSTL